MLGQSGSWVNGPAGVLGGKRVRTTRFFQVSSGTSGAVTLPPNSTVILDDFGGTTDAILSTMSGGKPSLQTPLTATGLAIGTTFDLSGNYVFTSAPTAYPVAVIYRVEQSFLDFDSTASNIIGTPNIIYGNAIWGTVIGDIDNQTDLIRKATAISIIFG